MQEYAKQQTAILLRRLAFQINRAARHVDADTVHDLRVAIRRLRRCLQVFGQFYPEGSWKRMRRRLSALMDSCGSVRDLDIAIELVGKAGVPADADVVRQLVQERRKAERELLAQVRVWKDRSISTKWKAQLEL
jgi:CHAD domain-containing protein